ncbi:hypothetical protein KM043_006204 [Ampulex compressa]|nr:hypothetical protein KM043_006204 [Ampulex compressa]
MNDANVAQYVYINNSLNNLYQEFGLPYLIRSLRIILCWVVLEALKQAVVDEDIVFESEVAEDAIETEIEEIIEIIEEVEEDVDVTLQDCTTAPYVHEKNADVATNDEYSENLQGEEFDRSLGTETYAFDEDNSVFKTQVKKEIAERRTDEEPRKSNNKQVITYDVHEDWQDEDVEHMEDGDEDMDNSCDMTNHHVESLQAQNALSGNKRSISNQSLVFPMQTNRLESKDNGESTGRVERSKLSYEFGENVNNASNIDNNGSHEIIKNVENNLLYTVLGTKKQFSAAKQSQQDKLSDAHYIKMEQLDENTIPVEGTIYYEGDNMETLYVAQAVDENEQYQYDAGSMEQEEHVWDAGNSDTNQNQEEENSQDQIFLHEDEDGQLYFKDETGALQPVYLTEDGNYAIAENSDDQDGKESQTKSQQIACQQEEEPFAIPDLEVRPAHVNKQSTTVPSSAINDLDNEDNTVTISLIISEDEHGQKRTQVIIPTTDTLKCDVCNKSFKTSFQLLRHNRLKHAREEDITTRNFPCDLCPKRYPDQNSLARHRKTHTGDRPFQCLECHKNFPTSTALRRHLTLHNSQSRPLPCIYCGRRFVEKSSLAKHEQSHLSGDQRTHTCDVCQKSFLHATDLSLHKKYHDPDKKFDCEQGANEEILSCDVCGITYKFMSSLTRHMVTTHMNPEKLRQQAEEQRRKRENNYRRYLENRKMYETQLAAGYGTKRSYHHNARILTGNNDETA